MRRAPLAACLLLAGATAAAAQAPVYNPRSVRFTHDDYATTTSYVLEFWLQGTVTGAGCVPNAGASPVSTYTAPQTAATATGTPTEYDIQLASFVPLIGTPIGSTYVGCIKARRDTEESPRSDASNPFSWLAALRSPRQVSFR